ncbi:hypothetical protein [Bacillus mobilis]|uniref:hypothetical protein n=1 Tax=Bacillus mobilis TaxID=2026190 RepID=UPI002E23AAA9|nr:hypothetical protein [Bacillus mobilis]MED0957890.1 hypothetical protein [Bacillus mobilis]
MVYQMFADYLRVRGINASYPKPKDGDNFIRGTVIQINGVKIPNKELDKSPYKNHHRAYLSRLKE